MSYASVVGHREMVFDGNRNHIYAEALRKIITPDSLVMDLGAGLGVHGFSAASLGAKEVHLVEPAPVMLAARKIAENNGLDGIYYHECRVEELRLDKRFDIIVSVFTGNFLVTEDLLPSLFFARDKYLKPDGILLPDRACMEVVPVSAAKYYDSKVESWSTAIDFAQANKIPEVDYSSVRSFASNTVFYDTVSEMKASPLARPASLAEFDFNCASHANCDAQIKVSCDQDGTMHGWLGWFQMRLQDSWLSTDGEGLGTHWSQVFLPLEEPIEVKAGDVLNFSLKRPEFGEWTWTTQIGEQHQRQSTFLSQPLSHDRILKASDSYKPTLSERGDAARWLLARLNGKLSVIELASQLRVHYPQLFVDHRQSVDFVKALMRRFN
ncbi:MAG: class I SAM-dependent methyltransferase [Halioglobus sp.]